MFGLIGMFALVFAMSFVVAQTEAGIYGTIEGEGIFTNFIKGLASFFGWENTWATVITSIAVLVMVYAAAYDILGFTAFDGKYTKIAIALGIALILAVTRGVTAITVFFMALAGGSVVIATIIAIGFAIVFFVIGSFWKGKMMVWKAKGDAATAKGGYVRAANAIGGLNEIDDAAAKMKK